MEKKKFQIRDVKKKFEIRPEEGTNTARSWFRQENENDCGPCLILNGLQRIGGAKHVPESIREVRQDVNRLRRAGGRPELAPNGWFTSEDVETYLRNVAGLSVREYACFADSMEEVSQNIRKDLEQPVAMIYSTAGRHFRGLVPIANGYEVLDSFNIGPEITNVEAVDHFIDRALHGSTPERIERIGIVRANG